MKCCCNHSSTSWHRLWNVVAVFDQRVPQHHSLWWGRSRPPRLNAGTHRLRGTATHSGATSLLFRRHQDDGDSDAGVGGKYPVPMVTGGESVYVYYSLIWLLTVYHCLVGQLSWRTYISVPVYHCLERPVCQCSMTCINNQCRACISVPMSHCIVEWVSLSCRTCISVSLYCRMYITVL